MRRSLLILSIVGFSLFALLAIFLLRRIYNVLRDHPEQMEAIIAVYLRCLGFADITHIVRRKSHPCVPDSHPSATVLHVLRRRDGRDAGLEKLEHAHLGQLRDHSGAVHRQGAVVCGSWERVGAEH